MKGIKNNDDFLREQIQICDDYYFYCNVKLVS